MSKCLLVVVKALHKWPFLAFLKVSGLLENTLAVYLSGALMS